MTHRIPRAHAAEATALTRARRALAAYDRAVAGEISLPAAAGRLSAVVDSLTVTLEGLQASIGEYEQAADPIADALKQVDEIALSVDRDTEPITYTCEAMWDLHVRLATAATPAAAIAEAVAAAVAARQAEAEKITPRPSAYQVTTVRYGLEGHGHTITVEAGGTAVVERQDGRLIKTIPVDADAGPEGTAIAAASAYGATYLPTGGAQ